MRRGFSYLRSLSGPTIGLLGVLGLFIALFAGKGELDRFVSLPNLQVLVHGDEITAVAALGALMIIISGGIDLSVGSVIALVTVVTMCAFRLVYGGPEETPLTRDLVEKLAEAGVKWKWAGTHSVAWASSTAIAAGLLVGGGCGFVNGLVITRLRVSPFVATLGMYSVARGLAFWVAKRQTISFPYNARPEWVNALSRVGADYIVFDPGFWILIVLALGIAVLLRYTVLGRYCYAIGSNEATARLCGVPIGRTKLAVYTLAGLLTGWAGVMMFAHLGSGDPSSARETELTVIAAVVIGGASLAGGQGTVIGALLGVLILALLKNGVRQFNVPVEVQYILIGVIIVVNTALSRWQRREGE